MKKYTAYILDDEPLAIRSLSKKLEDFPEIEIIGESTRMAKAKTDLYRLDPDILFLDIQLMEGTGFDFLNGVNYSGHVIFVTAFDEYAFRAFEINALDYLLKPVSHERLESTLKKLMVNSGENNLTNVKYSIGDRLLVTERSNMRFILISSIELIEAARDYSTIKTSEGASFLLLRSMKEWEDRLPPDHFLRIHRSYIVNINNIERITRHSTSSAKVYLKNMSEPVTLSRTYYKSARNRYM